MRRARAILIAILLVGTAITATASDMALTRNGDFYRVAPADDGLVVSHRAADGTVALHRQSAWRGAGAHAGDGADFETCQTFGAQSFAKLRDIPRRGAVAGFADQNTARRLSHGGAHFSSIAQGIVANLGAALVSRKTRGAKLNNSRTPHFQTARFELVSGHERSSLRSPFRQRF